MRLLILAPAAILSALVLIASSASAQSLGDFARQEEARRAAVKAAVKAKVLTNADLAAGPAAAVADAPATPAVVSVPATPPAAAAAPAPATSATPANDSAAATAAAAPTTKPKEDEGHWRRRAADLRARIEKAQKRLDALAGANHEDPREQEKVAVLVKKAQEEFTRATDALHLLQMQADIAGVPATWVQ